MELEPGFLPEMEHHDLNKVDAVESFSLQSLGSWQDLMTTMTKAEFEVSLEPSLEQSTVSMTYSVSNQVQQIVPEQSVAESVDDRVDTVSESELYKSGVDLNAVEKDNSVVRIEGGRSRARSLSEGKRKPGRKSKIGLSVHSLSKNNNIAEEDINETKSFRKGSTSELGSFTKISSEKTRKSLVKLGSQTISEKKVIAKSVINLDFGQDKASSLSELKLAKGVFTKPIELRRSPDDFKVTKDNQPSDQPNNIEDGAKDVIENTDSKPLDVKESGSEPTLRDKKDYVLDQIESTAADDNLISDNRPVDVGDSVHIKGHQQLQRYLIAFLL
jgi:hypothetical protein